MRAVAVSLAVVVAAQTGCGRLGFDLTTVGDGGAIDSAPTMGRWVTRIGKPAEPTGVARVLEGANGELWVFGTSFALGPNYTDPWFAKLDGETGALVDGGVRGYEGGESNVANVLPLTDGFLFVGSSYGDDSEQPVIGELGLDGEWRYTARMAGGLVHPGEFEAFQDARETSDGGLALVGFTRIGQGGCTTCKGIDALIVRLDAARTVTNVVTVGLAIGDESLFRMVELPNGDMIAFGGGHGSFDYSGGAGTDVDTTQAFATRFTTVGSITWTKQFRFPQERGSAVRAAVYDPTINEVVIGGMSDYGSVPFLAHMNPSGTVDRVREVILDDAAGSVTDIALAPDGGLYIAGYEDVPPLDVERNIYVAKLAPDRETVEWAIRATLAYFDSDLDVAVVDNGDLIVSAGGAGPMGTDALIARIGADGQTPACWNAVPATVTLAPVSDFSVNPGYAVTTPTGVTETLTSSTLSLPGTAAELSSTCSP